MHEVKRVQVACGAQTAKQNDYSKAKNGLWIKPWVSDFQSYGIKNKEILRSFNQILYQNSLYVFFVASKILEDIAAYKTN